MGFLEDHEHKPAKIGAQNGPNGAGIEQVTIAKLREKPRLKVLAFLDGGALSSPVECRRGAVKWHYRIVLRRRVREASNIVKLSKSRGSRGGEN
jgi:hypothetical protein